MEWPIFMLFGIIGAFIIGIAVYNLVTSLPKDERYEAKQEAYLLATYLQYYPLLESIGDITIEHPTNKKFTYSITPGLVTVSTHDKKITIYAPYTYPAIFTGVTTSGAIIILP